jgi:hypothetical protein
MHRLIEFEQLVVLFVTQSQHVVVVHVPELTHDQHELGQSRVSKPRHFPPLLAQLADPAVQHGLLQQLVLQQGEGPQQLGQQLLAATAGLVRRVVTPAAPTAVAAMP